MSPCNDDTLRWCARLRPWQARAGPSPLRRGLALEQRRGHGSPLIPAPITAASALTSPSRTDCEPTRGRWRLRATQVCRAALAPEQPILKVLAVERSQADLARAAAALLVGGLPAWGASAASAANQRPATVPALREWVGGTGAVTLRGGARIVVRRNRRTLRPGDQQLARGPAPPDQPALSASPPVAALGCVAATCCSRPRLARPRAGWGGLLPADWPNREDRCARIGWGLLRRAHAAPARAFGSPAAGGARPRLAPLPGTRADARQRASVLHARLAREAHPRARRPEAQPPAPALLRRPGLPAREQVAPGDRVEPAPDQGGRAPPGGARAPSAPDDRAGDRRARAHGPRWRATPSSS